LSPCSSVEIFTPENK